MSIKQKKRNFKVASLIISILILFFIGTQTTLLAPTYYRLQHFFTAMSTQEEQPTNSIPTVLIHGYSGSKWTFFTTDLRYSIENIATPSLVLRVQKDGSLQTSGVYDPAMKHPMIRIEFEDNTAKLKQNVKWLSSAMAELKNTYHINQIDVIGHSYGGLDFTYFTEYLYNQETFPEIHKFVALGTPFNGSAIGDDGVTDYDLSSTGPKKESIYFKKLKERQDSIPKQLHVLNIVGDLDDGSRSDGAVAVDSGLSAKFIFPSENYQEVAITGFWAAHSLLHENLKVDRLVQKFLWND
ncbi:alpha/beta hydrolase [Carnobacterium gallinarum]|uniref:alpha/beta hydrolase n=1 Tax=Carnobacterium gallinarum TaxID=2749 RepID=UPI00054D12F4|nr:alpha/beta hydrolase [Carnobacterium gallinarum]